MLSGEKGPFQMLFGEDASLDPGIVIPIASVVFVVMMILGVRIALKDKGKSNMTEEELKADRALFDDQMERQATIEGRIYKPEVLREMEKKEIAEARRRSDGYPDGPDKVG